MGNGREDTERPISSGVVHCTLGGHNDGKENPKTHLRQRDHVFYRERFHDLEDDMLREDHDRGGHLQS